MSVNIGTRDKHIDGPGGPNLITDWTNNAGLYAFDTFISSGADITSAIDNGLNQPAACNTNDLNVVAGDIIEIRINITNNIGTVPAGDLVCISTLLAGFGNLTTGLHIRTYTIPVGTTRVYIYFQPPTIAIPMNFSAVCTVQKYGG